MVRKWINRISKAIFISCILIAAIDFVSLYFAEKKVDVIWREAYHMSRDKDRKDTTENAFDLEALQKINPELYRIYQHCRYTFKLSGFTDRESRWHVLY